MNLRENKRLLPPAVIGIIGGGQLGRMMAIEAKYMGYDVIILDPTAHCPAAQVSDEQIIAAYDDLEAIKELTEKSDVVTYEFENIDLETAKYIEAVGKLPQGTEALRVTQNREAERELLVELGLPVSPFVIIRSKKEAEIVLDQIELPAVLKTARGGYDGKGQMQIKTKSDLPLAYDFIEDDKVYLVERFIPFDKEVSVVFTRSQAGDTVIFPLAENTHENHILKETIAPAAVSESVLNKVRVATRSLADALDLVGTFTIELFVINDGIFINELAPRPHNSGHYTIEACNVSQFNQHIRAICNLPLMEVEQKEKALMINVLGKDLEQALKAMKELKEAYVHLYGKKEAQPERKMGHITFLAADDQAIEKIKDKYNSL